MYWFLAKIVYQIVCGEGNHTAQFDEQLRLVQAADENEAFDKAQSHWRTGAGNVHEPTTEISYLAVCECLRAV